MVSTLTSKVAESIIGGPQCEKGWKMTYSVIRRVAFCPLSFCMGSISIERHFETNKHSLKPAAATARAELTAFSEGGGCAKISRIWSAATWWRSNGIGEDNFIPGPD